MTAFTRDDGTVLARRPAQWRTAASWVSRDLRPGAGRATQWMPRDFTLITLALARPIGVLVLLAAGVVVAFHGLTTRVPIAAKVG
jgi:hypothetical protein